MLVVARKELSTIIEKRERDQKASRPIRKSAGEIGVNGKSTEHQLKALEDVDAFIQCNSNSRDQLAVRC